MASSHNTSLIWLLKNVKEPLQGTWQSLLLIITTVLNFSSHSHSSSLGKSKEIKKKLIIIMLVVIKGSRCRRQWLKIKMLLLQHCALHKFPVIDGQNTCNQITNDRRSQLKWSNHVPCIPYSFLVEVQMNAGYIHVTHAWYQPGD